MSSKQENHWLSNSDKQTCKFVSVCWIVVWPIKCERLFSSSSLRESCWNSTLIYWIQPLSPTTPQAYLPGCPALWHLTPVSIVAHLPAAIVLLSFCTIKQGLMHFWKPRRVWYHKLCQCLIFVLVASIKMIKLTAESKAFSNSTARSKCKEKDGQSVTNKKENML